MYGPGFYRGRHFTEWVDTVKDLKRADRLEEAVTLLEGLVEATEAESQAQGVGVAPWYYEQLAIIRRKQHDPEAEVEMLERYERQPHAPGMKPPQLAARLEAARQRLRAN